LRLRPSPEVLSRCSSAASWISCMTQKCCSLSVLIPCVLVEQQLCHLGIPIISLYMYSRLGGGVTIPQSPCYTGLRVPRSSSNHTISGQNPPIAARGEAAVVSGHSPLCRASVGTVKPPTKPPRAVTCSQSGCPSDQVAWGSEDTTYALHRKECSRQRLRSATRCRLRRWTT
jgi:hypothetical protein